uniref:Centrosomin N-terminal motif 1 domain-containing protein n=1 Tax=Hucho hucho TaxID=62062 RepID=A0A4W5QIR5_9TELE
MGGSVAPCEKPVTMSNSFRGYRTISQHLNDLKKENFSLKLRIYFLEERIQQKYEDSSHDVHKRNIELKVEVESLKQELTEKQEILDKALSTSESQTNQNEEKQQRGCEARHQEISHMQEILETKVQLLQEEVQLARAEAEKMASLAEEESQRCLVLEREMMMRMEEEDEEECEGGSLGARLQKEALAEKERVIEELTEERRLLSHRVGELEVRVHDLSSSLQKKDRDAEVNKTPQLKWDQTGSHRVHNYCIYLV